MERKSQIPTFRRAWTKFKNSFTAPSKQIPLPPTGAEVVPDRTVHIGRSKYKCSIFPGTLEKDKAKRRKASKIAYKSKRFNILRAA